MYVRVTPMGLSVSAIEAAIRGRNAEFSFTVVTSHGKNYVFRYQKDASGTNLWHLYRDNEGTEFPAIEAKGRRSLGSLRLDYTDSEMDALVKSVEENPFTTTYLVLPGEGEADLVVMPLSRKIMAFIRAFVSAAESLVDHQIAQCVRKEIVEARKIQLSREQKHAFLNDPGSELGQIAERFEKEGFYMYSSGPMQQPMIYVPTFMKYAILGQADEEVICLEKNPGSDHNSLCVSCGDRIIARINNVTSVFSRYELMAKRQQMMEKKNRSRLVKKGQVEDLLPEWQKKHDKLKGA